MKILRLIILLAGCALLAFGLRLLYLRYYPDSSHEDKPVSIKITRSSSDQSGIVSSTAAGLREGMGDDPGSSSEVSDFTLPLAPSPAPSALKITTAKLPMGAVDVPYLQTLKVSGLTGTGAWKVTKGVLPPGLTFGWAGVLSGLPEKEGEWRFTVQVEDGKGDSARKEFRLLIRPPPREEKEEEVAISILTTMIADGFLGREYLQKIESEGGEPPYQWAMIGGVLPDLIHLNKQSGVLYGTPREVGRFQFTIRLTDNSGNFAENNFTLEVREGEIEIVTDALPPAVKEEKYSLTFRARGGVIPYRWEVVTGQLPRGLKFDPERGILSGIPEDWEISTFLIRVTGREGRSAEKEFTLEVLTDSFRTVNYHGLRIVTAQLPSAVRGQLYTEELTAVDGSPPYIWTISQGDLPPSLSLESDTGRISGIPEQAGRSVFTVLVSDTERRVDQREFTLTVDYQLVYITTGSLLAAVAGEAYSQSIEATGGTPPYTFSLESGYLPDGLSFNGAAGQIQGTVSDIYLGQGTQEFIFRIKAVDQAGYYDIVELRITVRETAQPTPLFSPTPPTLSSPTPVPTISPVGLHISTSSLPDGVLGENYNQTLTALGGGKPYAWSMSNLPPGLSGSSSGTISGVPEIAADYPVDVSVTDSDGTVASKTLNLTIKENQIEGVSDLIGAPGDGKVGLAWTNPAGSDFKRIMVLRKTGGYPQTADDGEVAYEGTGDNIIDQGLTNSIPYFYAVITYNQEGSPGGIGSDNRIEITPLEVSISGENDPFADEVISFSPLSQGGFGSPDIVLGAPRGEGKDQGSLDVVSLHARVYDGTTPCGGSIILKFNNNLVWDGDGVDFTIFENVFDIGGDEAKRWMEPAIVSVSQDGNTYYTFPYDYVPHYDGNGEIDYYNPYSYMDGDGTVRGFAGIHPVFSNNGTPDPTNPSVSGGDSFDLSDITGKDMAWIQYIKLTATGDDWKTDINNDKVRHVQDMGACSGAGSSGLDLDAVSAVNY